MDTLSSISTILVSVLTLICIAQSHILFSKVPKSVPWTGVRQEVLSKLRACLREFTFRSPTAKAGYKKVFHTVRSTLELLTSLLDSSVKKAYPTYSRILDFGLLLWFLRNTSAGCAISRTVFCQLANRKYVSSSSRSHQLLGRRVSHMVCFCVPDSLSYLSKI